jgi:lipooligosaccharide transport system permease protein
VHRNLVVYRRGWLFLVTGVLEPFFYLLSIGVGLSHLVGPITVGTARIGYTAYVAPGMLATATMNGTVFDSTYGVFHKLKIDRTYESILSTPLGVGDVALGEILWAVLRGSLYATTFLLVMAAFGLVVSPWAILALPAALLLGFAFAAIGMAGTSYLRSFQDFDIVVLVTLPLFLFSATFYPLSVYPGWLQVLVQCTPLYQGVALIRSLDLGQLSFVLLGHAAYLVAMTVVGLTVSSRRLERLILP